MFVCFLEILNFGRVKTVDMDIWNVYFFVSSFNFEIFGKISPQEDMYGPYGPYIVLESPYMDRTDLVFLEEGPYMDRQSIYFW